MGLCVVFTVIAPWCPLWALLLSCARWLLDKLAVRELWTIIAF